MTLLSGGKACLKCDNLVTCICTLKEQHKPNCRYLIVAGLSVEIPCDHGYQACPTCDPCTCGSEAPLVPVR